MLVNSELLSDALYSDVIKAVKATAVCCMAASANVRTPGKCA